MMQTKGSFILVMVGLVSLGGWLAKADPPATAGAEEIADSSGSAVPGSQQRFRHRVRVHEYGLQGSDEAAQHHGSAAHQQGPVPGAHRAGTEGNAAPTEAVTHHRHQNGMIAGQAGGMMSSNAPGPDTSMMRRGSGMMNDGTVPEMHRGDGMMWRSSNGVMMRRETQPQSSGGMPGGTDGPGGGGAAGGPSGGMTGGGG